LEHHPELIGGLEVILGWSPAVMPDVVETVIAGQREAAAELALVRRRADRVRKNTVVTVAAQKDGPAVEEKEVVINILTKRIK
jgi:hypothetical protein